MATVVDALDDALVEWIEAQPVFFVGSAPADGGHVNISPKGYDSFRVLGPRSVAYLDLTGSGAETIAHTRENGRLTIMFCAFQGPPRILRLYGTGTAHLCGSPGYEALAPRFDVLPGARSIVALEIDRISTSCGYSVPFLSLEDERPTLQQWAARKDDDAIAAYWAQKNRVSIDGLPAVTPRG
jgi:hypothetical protein